MRLGKAAQFIVMKAAVLLSFSTSVRIGVAYFITSFAILTGTPIAGALLKGNNWGKPIAFSGVRLSHSVGIRPVTNVRQVTVLAGFALFLLSRQMYAKKRGSRRI